MLLVRRMREMAATALDFVEGMEGEDFLADLRTQQAITMNLFVIGELAARALRDMPELVARYPDIPWSAMRGMRNRIAHGYFSLDLDTMWSTVKDDLPALLAEIDRALGT